MTLPVPRALQREEDLDRVRRAMGWFGAESRGSIRAGSIPFALQPEEMVLFTANVHCGLGLPVSSFFLMLLEDYGIQLQHLTPYSILLAAVFVHLYEMFVGVKPCVALFRHYFVLKKTGKSDGEVGGYYFQTRSGASYILGFAGAKWEHWRRFWFIILTEPHDRLVLPTGPPACTSQHRRARPYGGKGLLEEFDPVLEKISKLAADGLTSLHVFVDFTTCWLAPLHRRARPAWAYFGTGDGCRIGHGVEFNLMQEELEELVHFVTGEAIDPNLLFAIQLCSHFMKVSEQP